MPKGIPAKYIKVRQALELVDIKRKTLYYHVRAGNIRHRKLNGSGGIRLNIDDVRTYGWPRVSDLADEADYSESMIHYLIRRFRIPGLEKFGRQYRISPRWFDDVVQWLRDGHPVRRHFLPKESGSVRADVAAFLGLLVCVGLIVFAVYAASGW